MCRSNRPWTHMGSTLPWPLWRHILLCLLFRWIEFLCFVTLCWVIIFSLWPFNASAGKTVYTNINNQASSHENCNPVLNQIFTPCGVMLTGIIKLKFPNSIWKSLRDWLTLAVNRSECFNFSQVRWLMPIITFGVLIQRVLSWVLGQSELQCKALSQKVCTK